MITEQEQKNIIAENIVARRKAMGLTQLELAERLNYSDKAISKWERADAVPDVFILRQIAELFGATVDELINPYIAKKVTTSKPRFLRKRVIIPMLSGGLVWVVAVVLYAVFVFFTNIPETKAYLVFMYALPSTAVVVLVFSVMWWKRFVRFWVLTALLWTLALALFLTFPIESRFVLFIIPIPIQVLFVLWYILFVPSRRHNDI